MRGDRDAHRILDIRILYESQEAFLRLPAS